MVIFIVWPEGRNSWAVLLNVCQLVSHQHVYPGVSGQQCVCTMWLWLQPRASYSLSFPDLSHAHSHQSALCNSMPRFLFFFPLLSLLAFGGQPDCAARILYTHQSLGLLKERGKKRNPFAVKIALVIGIALCLLITGFIGMLVDENLPRR